MTKYKSTPIDALRRAIELAGGVSALASQLNTGQSTVSNWLMRGQVAIGKCQAIERVTDGVVTCHELRPDVFPAPKCDAVA